jgi:hypothetical protein
MKFSLKPIKLYIFFIALLFISHSPAILSQTHNGINPDSIKAGRFDTGKMWTFEYPPTEYFKEAYGFIPDKEWYEHVQLATLKFADYCSASFVSEDGLIMTNHHCARESVTEVMSEDEELHKNGFIACNISDERQVPGLYVEQCVDILDVTMEIHSALEKANSDSERSAIEAEKILEIESRYQNDDEAFALVTPLFFGGKYSLYLYKRYNDVRLVFAPEAQAGYFGGDFDNFTYPRYNLDCSFFRAYDTDGNPLKVKYYFKWSESGAQPGEVVFVSGNPGSTSRLNTVAQLEYARDYTYPHMLKLMESFIELFEGIIQNNPDAAYFMNDQLLNYYNSKKAYTGMLEGLRDPVLMQKKRDFENTLRQKVTSSDQLNKKYGSLWLDIENSINEMRELIRKQNLLSYYLPNSSEYFFIAGRLMGIAEELRLAETDSSYAYTEDETNQTINSLMPEDFDFEKNNKLLKDRIELLYAEFGDEEFLKIFTGGKKADEAVADILSRSILTSAEKIKAVVLEGSEAILNCNDPFIEFIKFADQREEIMNTRMGELAVAEEAANQKLGKVLFEVYGTSIPPDATFTLRISDGVVKGFDYNGTIAPPVTTFYGLLDRYYSFDGKFPWSLNERWLNAPEEFEFSIPFNFVATCDVVGGNSGSPFINRNAEIVGVAFDGNIQSLPGDFIYDPAVNRTVGVHSAGMLEAIRKLYKFERLAEELKNGKSDY